jgi:hypothetical protein
MNATDNAQELAGLIVAQWARRGEDRRLDPLRRPDDYLDLDRRLLIARRKAENGNHA